MITYKGRDDLYANIYSTEYFCNTKVSGLGEYNILSSENFGRTVLIYMYIYNFKNFCLPSNLLWIKFAFLALSDGISKQKIPPHIDMENVFISFKIDVTFTLKQSYDILDVFNSPNTETDKQS